MLFKLVMAEDQHSSSSSDSDSSESSTVSLSHMLKPETFPLLSMDSSSESEESFPPVAPNLHIKVKKIIQDRDGISSFMRWKTTSSDKYFKDVVTTQENIKFFPEQMETFLSTNCKRTYLELSNLQHGTFFIYLARSLIVTLNVDNPRVRDPKSLVFDACIFSEDNPVVVLSVFNSDDVSKRMEMYNTFVARGVTDTLRTWIREDISITNSAVIIDGDLRTKVQRLWENPGLFHIQSSLKMWRDKAETVAIALLKVISVASSFHLLYPDKVDSDDVWFFTPSEFQFLTNFIDLQGDTNGVTVEGDALLLQTEIGVRLRKRYKTALLVTSHKLEAQKILIHFQNAYKSLEELEGGDSNYELVITDVPIESVLPSRYIFIGFSGADVKIPKRKAKPSSYFSRFLRKKTKGKQDLKNRKSDGDASVSQSQRTTKKEQVIVESTVNSYSETLSLDNQAIINPSPIKKQTNGSDDSKSTTSSGFESLLGSEENLTVAKDELLTGLTF